jgi:HEAT repeat protein
MGVVALWVAGCAAPPRRDLPVADLGSEEQKVREHARAEFMAAGPEGLRVLRDAMKDEGVSTEAKREALVLVGLVCEQHPKYAPEGIDVAMEAVHYPAYRRDAVAALSKIGRAAVEPIAEQMLDVESEQTRVALAAAARLIGDERIVRRMIEVLRENRGAVDGDLDSTTGRKITRASRSLMYLTGIRTMPITADLAPELRERLLKDWLFWWSTEGRKFRF